MKSVEKIVKRLEIVTQKIQMQLIDVELDTAGFMALDSSVELVEKVVDYLIG